MIMRLKGSFVTHTLGGETVVVPAGDSTRTFRGMIRLNASGVFLWRLIEAEAGFTRAALVEALMDRYGVDEATAAAAVDPCISSLTAAELLEVVDPDLLASEGIREVCHA